MACDVMAVRLHLPQIRVLEVVEDTPGALRVSVESTFRRLRCPQCGFRCHRVHDRRDKKIRDLEVSGRRTVLVWSRRRMVCDNCDSRFLEDHPAFEGALTGRLARRLVADAKVMTFNAVARRHGVHWHGVRALVDTWSALVAERRRSRRCSVLLVDETSMRKRHSVVPNTWLIACSSSGLSWFPFMGNSLLNICGENRRNSSVLRPLLRKLASCSKIPHLASKPFGSMKAKVGAHDSRRSWVRERIICLLQSPA